MRAPPPDYFPKYWIIPQTPKNKAPPFHPTNPYSSSPQHPHQWNFPKISKKSTISAPLAQIFRPHIQPLPSSPKVSSPPFHPNLCHPPYFLHMNPTNQHPSRLFWTTPPRFFAPLPKIPRLFPRIFHLCSRFFQHFPQSPHLFFKKSSPIPQFSPPPSHEFPRLRSPILHHRQPLFGKNHKKSHFFCELFWRLKFLPYLCTIKQNNWWIHLRVRIRASHARHSGSNPLSTTQKTANQ